MSAIAIAGVGRGSRNAPAATSTGFQPPLSVWSSATSLPDRLDSLATKLLETAPAERVDPPCVMAARYVCAAPFGIDPSEVPYSPTAHHLPKESEK